jgi:glucose/arabinose dehydrogenase
MALPIRILVCLILLPALLLLARGQAEQPGKQPPAPRGPLTPQEAVKHFLLPAGLRIELVAAEPQLESPVAMAFDEDGKL